MSARANALFYFAKNKNEDSEKETLPFSVSIPRQSGQKTKTSFWWDITQVAFPDTMNQPRA